MAKLVVLSEGFKGRTYELKTVLTTIGRVDDNAFELAEPSVSSHHCEILLRGSDIIVKDLNSTNGTYINGQQVNESPLKPGQVLRLGQVELRLEGDASAVPPPSKKFEQTMVIPQGVKMNQLEPGAKSATFTKDSPFAKKSNKGTKIFVAAAIVVGLVIVGLIVWAISNIQ
jgi:pSer/pThr/pTyr-binding forkhead associated (FHA) protein